MLPVFTTTQVKDGFGSADLMIDLSEYIKKKDVEDLVTQEEFNSLTTVVASKLDATPQHKHHIDDIKQLEQALAGKYDKGERYPHNQILSDVEKISYIEAPELGSLKLGGYCFSVDESNGDLMITAGDNMIATYSKASHNWIFEGFNIGSLVDGQMLVDNISALDVKINNVETILKNHYDAILLLCQQHGLVDSNTNDGDKVTPK